MRSDEAGVEPLQSVERAADVGGAVGFQCGEDAPQGLDVVAQEDAAFSPQGVHGGGFGMAELFEGDGDFVEHFECPCAVVDGYGEAFDVEAVEQGLPVVGKGQRVDVGDGFGQLLGGDVLNRADVEARWCIMP